MKAKSFLFALPFLLASSLIAGPVLEVRNAEGKALQIQLIAVEGENVVFSTTGKDVKEHTLALAKFDGASQEKLREAGKALPPRLPKLDIDVSISNRRDKKGYFMVEQVVSSKVKLRNLSTQIPYPAAKGYVVYFGQDRRNPGMFKVMGNKSFDFSIEPNKAFETDVLGFKTSYDSDNKGAGNIGGYQYECYVLVLTNAEGKVLATKTTDGSLRTAIDKDVSKAERLVKMNVDQVLNKELEAN
ncbi:hypothetical protein [Luteolibacter sp. Populi]|uniref:hypothetical protein n=1 Tax=Luteolibacter sp. Populi TaxID=3230487 RepID=UPI0034656AB3